MEPIFIPMASVFGLVLLSGFFSGSETGLTSVARPKIHKLKMEGNSRAFMVSKLRENKEQLIGAILLGNNIVNIASSAIATSLAISMFGESGVVYATIFMTLLVLVFAEVLPKTYAVRNAEQVALMVAPMFMWITRVFSPFTMAIQYVVDKLLNKITSEPEEEMSGVEVLRGAVDLYHEEGSVLKEDKDMLSGIFDLEQTKVEQIMIHHSDMFTINVDQPMKDILRTVSGSTYSRIPVWQDNPNNVIGILYSKDLFKLVHGQNQGIESIDLKSLLRKAMFIPENKSLKNQLKDFQAERSHIAILVDEFGSVTGMVTLEDVIEQVVGEINDETDGKSKTKLPRLKDGSYVVDGDTLIRDINRELEWNISETEALTVAGYVMAIAQRIPDEGDLFEQGDYMFKVEKKVGNRLSSIQIRDTSSERTEIKQEAAF